MKNRTLITLLFILTFQQVGYGQFEGDSLKLSNQIQAKNAIFVEVLGTGGLYSINYERVVSDNLTFRSGISYLDSDGFIIGKLLTIPVSSSYLIPTDKDSHIEMGVGNTFILNEGKFSDAIGPILGLREQDLFNGGAYARIVFTPFIIFTEKEVEIAPIWGGISFGTSF